MLYTFEHFCCSHTCAKQNKNRADYCPIADEVQKRYGKIDGTKCCEMYYELIYERIDLEDALGQFERGKS